MAVYILSQVSGEKLLVKLYVFGKSLQDNCMHKLLSRWHTPVLASLANIVLVEVNSYWITTSEFLSNVALGNGIGDKHIETQANAIF